MGKSPIKKSKKIIFNFCTITLGTRELQRKLEYYYRMCEKLKKMF